MARLKPRCFYDIQCHFPGRLVVRITSRKDVEITMDDVARECEEFAARIRRYQADITDPNEPQVSQ